MMRVLTVRQPWAWAIIHGGKDVENRVRNIAGNYRGPVAIQAGLARFEEYSDMWEVRRAIRSEQLGWPASDGETWAADMVEPTDPRFTYGAILGVVDLVAMHEDNCLARGNQRCGGCCSPWAQHDTWHLELASPRPLAEPIPYRGALGLRTLTTDVEDQVLARLDNPTGA